jgi:hypothetical protein
VKRRIAVSAAAAVVVFGSSAYANDFSVAFTTGARAGTQAVRGDSVQLTEPPVPPTTVAADRPPAGLDDCAEFSWYRQRAGLPAWFDRIAWRESNCRNEDGVKTYCCVGYLQLYASLHLRDHRLAPKYAACGVDSESDINSDTHEDKLRHLCAAAALYSVVGDDAWALTR